MQNKNQVNLSYKNKPKSEWSQQDWEQEQNSFLDEYDANNKKQQEQEKNLTDEEQADLAIKKDAYYQQQHPSDIALENRRDDLLAAQGGLKNLGLGFVDALENMGKSTANLIPGVHFKPTQRGSGVYYTTGNFAGNVAPLLAGAGLATRGLTLAAEEAPAAISAVAKWLGRNKITSASLGNAAYGGITQGLTNDPDASSASNRIKNALLWGGTTAGMGGLFEGIPKLANKMNPQTKSNKFMDVLSQGENLTDLPGKVIKKVRDAYDHYKGVASDKYNAIFSGYKNDFPRDTFKPDMFGKDNYEFLGDPKNQDIFTNGIKNQLNIFKNNPTLENAHWLQSEIGHEAARLGKSSDPRGSTAAINLSKIRNNIKSDIEKHFSLNPSKSGYRDAYKEASDFYRDKVAPFRDSDFNDYALGNITNSKAGRVAERFAAPDARNLEVIKNINDYHNNSNMAKNILFMRLGLNPKNIDPNKLKGTADYFEKAGYGQYLRDEPDITKALENVDNARFGKDMAYKTVSGLAGLLTGHRLGIAHDTVGNLVSTAAGLALSKPLENSSTAVGKGIGKLIGKGKKGSQSDVKIDLSDPNLKFSQIAKAALKSAILPTNQQPYRD